MITPIVQGMGYIIMALSMASSPCYPQLTALPGYPTSYGILPYCYYMSKSVAVQVGKELKATRSAKITQSLFHTVSGLGTFGIS